MVGTTVITVNIHATLIYFRYTPPTPLRTLLQGKHGPVGICGPVDLLPVLSVSPHPYHTYTHVLVHTHAHMYCVCIATHIFIYLYIPTYTNTANSAHLTSYTAFLGISLHSNPVTLAAPLAPAEAGGLVATVRLHKHTTLNTTCYTTSNHSNRTAWKKHRSEERRVGKECRSRWSPDH